MNSKRPKIRGTEVEYGFAVCENGIQKVTFFKDEKRQPIFQKCLPEPLKMAGTIIAGDKAGYLSNGGRLYLDTGFHPEYATPEALFAEHIVMYEKAGDYIIGEIVRRANEQRRDEGIVMRALKNNTAPKDPEDSPQPIERHNTENQIIERTERTYGSHESFLMERRDDLKPEKLVGPLGLFLASRVLFGSGKFWIDSKRRIRFRLSQRSPHIIKNEGGATTSDRALINTRDEPHAGADKRRLHLILGDSNLAEVAIFLKNATTTLMLEMLESGWAGRMPTAGDAFQYWALMQTFSDDSSLTTTQTLQGKTHSVVDIHEIHYRLAEQYCAEEPSEIEEVRQEREMTLKLWARVIDGARTRRPHETLAPMLDWAAKKLVVEKDLDKRGLALHSNPNLIVLRERHKGKQKITRQVSLAEHVLELDDQYHVLENGGLWQRLNEKGSFERIVDDEDIAKCVFDPIPETTRACARAAEIAYAIKYPEMASTDPGWTRSALTWSEVPSSNPYLDPYDWKPKHPLLKNNQPA